MDGRIFVRQINRQCSVDFGANPHPFKSMKLLLRYAAFRSQWWTQWIIKFYGVNQSQPGGSDKTCHFLGPCKRSSNCEPWQHSSSSARNQTNSTGGHAEYIPLAPVGNWSDKPNFRTLVTSTPQIQEANGYIHPSHSVAQTFWAGQPSDFKFHMLRPSCMTLASRMGSMGGFVACAKSWEK